MVGVRSIGGLGAALAGAGKAAVSGGASGPAGSGGAAGIGAIAGIVLLVPMEAGVPVPVPADLVMLAVGARVGAGDIPLWVAVLAFEAVAVIGTAALFAAARGPGHALVRRFGPRLGLAATAVWFARRGRRHGTGGLAEAACPACLGLALLAERPAEVRAAVVEDAAPGPALEPR